jgi:IQ calmodulin-binding motif
VDNVRLLGEHEINLSDFLSKIRVSSTHPTHTDDVTGMRVALPAEAQSTGGQIDFKLSLVGRKKGVVFVVDMPCTMLECRVLGPNERSDNTGLNRNNTDLTANPALSRRDLGLDSTPENEQGVYRTDSDPGPGSGRSNRRVLVSEYVVDIVTAVLYAVEDSEGFKTFIGGSVPSTDGPRLRRTLRQRAQRDGHVGGSKVISKEEAAVKLQSTWRSKRVRKIIRRKYVCVVAIQRMVRGMLARSKYEGELKRAKERRKEEKERLERLRRIRHKERELAVLKRVPVSDYLKMENLRQDNCAKTVQKAYRNRLKATNRGHLIPGHSKGSNRVGYLGGILGGVMGGYSEAKKEAARAALRRSSAGLESGSSSDPRSPKELLEAHAAAVHSKKLLEKVAVSITHGQDPRASGPDTGTGLHLNVFISIRFCFIVYRSIAIFL